MNNLSNPDADQALQALLPLLATAHTNAQAAAHAHTGHSRGLLITSAERRKMRSIAQASAQHARTLHVLLLQLHAPPSPRRRFITGLMNTGGQILGMLCLLGGRLLPLYATRWWATHSLNLYIKAAQYAWLADHPEIIPELLELAEAAGEHAEYAQQGVSAHWLGKHLKGRKAPSARQNIRSDFARFCQHQQRQRIDGDLQQLKSDPSRAKTML